MTTKSTQTLDKKLFADLQLTDEVIGNDYAADGVTVVSTARIPVGDLLRKGIVPLDAPLATVNSENTVSVAGPIFGQTTDDHLVVKLSQAAGVDGWAGVGSGLVGLSINSGLIVGPSDENLKTSVGGGAINIQVSRPDDTQIASGDFSVAIGASSKSTSYTTIAIGAGATALNQYSTSIGTSSQSSASSAIAIGQNTNASSNNSIALGAYSEAGGTDSLAVGYLTKSPGFRTISIGPRIANAVAEVAEFGFWGNAATRETSIRLGRNSSVCFSILNSAAPLADGGATTGAELKTSLPRNMFSFRRSGTQIYIDLNIAGTITSIALGDVSAFATAAQGVKADTALQPSVNVNIAGTTHTMTAANEGQRLRATNAASCQLTLIEFSSDGATMMWRQVSAASPTLGVLPTGMTIDAVDQAKFANLAKGGDVTFVCVDATPGSQVVEII